MTIRIVLVLALAAQTALAQQPAVSLRGQVVDAENDRLLRRAIVSLARGDDRVRPVLTDEEGRFEIELPEASSEIVIAKAGYASTILQRDPRTQSRELDIRLPRGATMSGRVIESGIPVIGARVVARPIDDVGRGAPTYEADTDDLGEFHIGGVPAGQYTVSALNAPQGVRIYDDGRVPAQGLVTRRPGSMQRAPPNLRGPVPGVGSAARIVDVRAGEETGDVDLETFPVALPPIAALVKRDAQYEQFEGAITGRVVSQFGQPIASAMIGISGDTLLRTVVADANGQFDAGHFPDGTYRIETGKVGYLWPELTADPDATTSREVRVGGGARVHDVEIVLARGGAVAGTIVDSAGEPLQGVLVRALRLRQDGGLTRATAASPRLTDDRGRYRLSGLAKGSYLIVASLNATERATGASRARGFAPVYYPATSLIESAQSVRVEVGNAITGVDLTFGVSSIARVRGTALTAEGTPLIGRVSLVTSHRSGIVAADLRTVRIDDRGSFELTDVPPGDYVLQAFADPGPGTPREFGSEYVAVGDSDPPPVEITTSAGATLDGRFVADDRSNLPMRAQTIQAAPLDMDRSPGARGVEALAVHDDGRFYLTGLFGQMRLNYPALPGWYLKSVTIGGVDVTDMPVDFGFGNEIFPNAEIVISNAAASITGSIEDGNAAPNASVVAFPVSRANWFAGSRHLKRVTTTPNGAFDVSGLPPGEYFVAAATAVPPDDWQSPTVLDALTSQATRVTVREGQTLTITLRMNRR